MTAHALITIIVLVLVTPFMIAIAIIKSRFDPSGNGPHLVARVWAGLLLKASRVRVEVRGLGNLEPGETYVLIANHSSIFDILVLLAHIPLQFRWLAKAELFDIPFFGRSLASCGYIPISRSSPRDWIRSLKGAVERIRKGASVVVFPEGTRSTDGTVHEFKRGGFELAVRSGQPVVPVSIIGAHRILPTKSLALHPGLIRVVIDRPLPTKGLKRSEQDRFMEQVRRIIISNYSEDRSG
jgi:1-acyl-sn-glycerol-3-phosphate acyltransferase